MGESENGYTVFRKWVDVPQRVFKRFSMVSRVSKPIFNSAKGNDERRRQCTVRKNGTVWMKRVCENLPLNGREAGSCVVIRSLAGCEAQAPHCDYIPTESLLACTEDTIPCGFLVALQDGTTLDVWPQSHRLVRGEVTRKSSAMRRTRLFLNKGDAVLFRGDLIHAGSSYGVDNIRLHFYLDHASCKRIRNRTWLAHPSWKFK